MAKAEPVDVPKDRAELANAGDAVMLLVNPGLWDVIRLQAQHEGTTPGAVLAKATEDYVRAHGSAEVKRAILERR